MLDTSYTVNAILSLKDDTSRETLFKKDTIILFHTVTDASHANPNRPNDPNTPSKVKSTPSKSDLIELL